MSTSREEEDDAPATRHLSSARQQVAHYAASHHHAALDEALETLIDAHPAGELPIMALAGLDQLHLGGVTGTRELLALARLEPQSRGLSILELGAGLGGLARHIASQSRDTGANHRITTLDLSSSLCELAIALNRATGLRESIRVLEGDACYPELHPALSGRRFDRLFSQHLLVHLSDKVSTLTQWHDCLEQDGYLLLHEPVLSVQAQAFGERPALPLPWALSPRGDQLASCEELHEAMASSGFEVDAHVELTDQVLSWQARRMRESTSEQPSAYRDDAPAPSPAMLAARGLTPELVFGPAFSLMQRNLMLALEAGWLEVHLWRLRKRPARQ